MLDAQEMCRVVGKARAKLLELYGDLEKVRCCAGQGVFTAASCHGGVVHGMWLPQAVSAGGDRQGDGRFMQKWCLSCGQNDRCLRHALL